MNGPKPVWMLATNRLNQSRPRPAASDLVPGERVPGDPVPEDPSGCRFAGGGYSARSAIRSLLAFRRTLYWRLDGRLRRRRCLWRHQCLRVSGVLVFRCRLQLLPAHGQSQSLALVVGIEAQQRPIDGNAAVADAQEAAELDDGNTHSPAG